MDMMDCKRRGFVKTAKLDTNKIRALLRIAERKQEASGALSNDFYESKLTLLYDAIRTILESLALKNCLKIYNHECYTAFLKEVLNKSRLGDEFDGFRKLRNAINYYGKELSKEEALDTITQMKRFIEEIKLKNN